MSTPAEVPLGGDLRSLAVEIQGTMDLVDQLVKEVQVGAQAHQLQGRLVELAGVLKNRPDLTALPGLVVRAYSEVSDALGGIKRGREAIRHVTFERLQKSHAKLSEVASDTESATMELMNGIDRSLGLIDKVAALVPAEPEAGEAIEALRGELNMLFGHLQFQDITAQQLAGVGNLLEDIEFRVQSVASMFGGKDQSGADGTGPDGSFNADASFADVKTRQAAIDAAFGKPGQPAAAQA